MNLKKLSIVVLILTVLAVGVGVSAAQTGTPVAPNTPGGNGRLRLGALAQDGMFSGRQRPLLTAILDATGMTRLDLIAALGEGQSLDAIITAHGGDSDAIITQAVSAATEQINTAVTSGKLTQDKADKLIAALQPTFESVVSGEWEQQAITNRARLGLVLLAAQQTGLTPEAVISQIKGGSSLAQVLTEHNIDTNAFIEDAAARVQARLNVYVVDGRISQQQADDALAKFRDELTKRIDKVPGATESPVATETLAA